MKIYTKPEVEEIRFTAVENVTVDVEGLSDPNIWSNRSI